MTSDRKAFIVSIFFLVVGIGAFWWTLDHNSVALSVTLPLFIFYLTIVVNTFFSIRLFAAITPKENLAQKICDAMLVLLYIAMALSMGNALHFVFFDVLLFVVATAKYIFLAQIVHYPKLFRRKIWVDVSGIILGLLILAGISAGFALQSAWVFASIFVIANILLFFVWPLYHLHHDKEHVQ